MDRNIGAAATNANGNRVAQCRPSFLFVAPMMTEGVERDTQTERASERASEVVALVIVGAAGRRRWTGKPNFRVSSVCVAFPNGNYGEGGEQEGRKVGACLDGISGFWFLEREEGGAAPFRVSSPRANFELEIVPTED